MCETPKANRKTNDKGAVVSFCAHVESWWPLVVGVLAGVVLYICNPATDRTAEALDRVMNGGIGAASVLAGFQVTALTLLLSIADKPVVKRLRNLGYYDRLILFHEQSIMLLLGWLVLSLVFIIVQGGTLDSEGHVSDGGVWTRWSAIILIAVASAAVGACLRVTRLTIKLLRVTAKSEPAG